MSATSFTPAFGYDSVDDGWELESSASALDDGWTLDEPDPAPVVPKLSLVAEPEPAPAPAPAPIADDGWSVANDEAPRLELTDAEQAFFDEGDALVDQKVDTFEDLDPTPDAPPRPSLWRRLLRRG